MIDTAAYARNVLKHIQKTPGVTTQVLREAFTQDAKATPPEISEVINFLYRDMGVIENRGGRALGASWFAKDAAPVIESDNPESPAKRSTYTMRERALELAISWSDGTNTQTVVDLAKSFEEYLQGA